MNSTTDAIDTLRAAIAAFDAAAATMAAVSQAYPYNYTLNRAWIIASMERGNALVDIRAASAAVAAL